MKLAAFAALTFAGCFGPELPITSCEQGLCPVGFICDPDTQTCLRPGNDGPFGDVERIAEVEDYDLTDPTATDDLLELYFERNDPDGSDDIFVSIRGSIDDPWPEPAEIDGELAMGESFSPEVSRDGLLLSISRPTGNGEALHLASRPSRSADFVDLGEVPELVDSDDTTHLSISADGTVAVFDSDRMTTDGDRQLFEVRRPDASARWGNPRRIEELTIGGVQRGPNLSPDGLTLYHDQRSDGDREIYRASRSSIDAPFEYRPVAELNEDGQDWDVWVSGDERTAIWVSDRDGTDYIYMATR